MWYTWFPLEIPATPSSPCGTRSTALIPSLSPDTLGKHQASASWPHSGSSFCLQPVCTPRKYSWRWCVWGDLGEGQGWERNRAVRAAQGSHTSCSPHHTTPPTHWGQPNGSKTGAHWVHQLWSRTQCTGTHGFLKAEGLPNPAPQDLKAGVLTSPCVMSA